MADISNDADSPAPVQREDNFEEISYTISLLLNLTGLAIQIVGTYKETETAQVDEASELNRGLQALESSLRNCRACFNEISGHRSRNPGFSGSVDVKQATENFKKGLRNIEDLFAGIKTASDSQNMPKSQYMHYLINMKPNIADIQLGDIRGKTEEVRGCTSRSTEAFKQILHLYLIHESRSSPLLLYQDLEGPQVDWKKALDEVNGAFDQRPFSICSQKSKKRLSEALQYINQNETHVKELQCLMKHQGSQWVEQEILRIRNFDATRTNELEHLQILLFKLIWSGSVEVLKETGKEEALASAERSELFYERALALDRSLERVIARSRREHFSIAVCGTVKAGKSTLLNALIGQFILPSDRLPSTAWPCRIRHSSGQKEPVLEFNRTPFLSGLDSIQRARIGDKLVDSEWNDEYLSEEDHQLMDKVAKLHKESRHNLDSFTESTFKLPKKATGTEAVIKLLGQLNDIVRICYLLELPFEPTDDWPMVTVEFLWLKGLKTDGIYEFIDTPGLGEYDEMNRHAFDQMVTMVADECNAILPIVSLTHATGGACYDDLANVLGDMLERKPSTVICTRLDQFDPESAESIMNIVRDAFYPKDRGSKVLACSAMVGMGAVSLLSKSQNEKPAFEDFWDTRLRTPEALCASQILTTTARAQKNFSRTSHDEWLEDLEEQKKTSNLDQVVQSIAQDLVSEGKCRAALRTCENIKEGTCSLIKDQERNLLELRRNDEDFRQAKSTYHKVRVQLISVLEAWSSERIRQSYQESVENKLNIVMEKKHDILSSSIVTAKQKGSKYLVQDHNKDEKFIFIKVKFGEGLNERQFMDLIQKEVEGHLYQEVNKLHQEMKVLLEEAQGATCQALKAQTRNNILDQLKPPTSREIAIFKIQEKNPLDDAEAILQEVERKEKIARLKEDGSLGISSTWSLMSGMAVIAMVAPFIIAPYITVPALLGGWAFYLVDKIKLDVNQVKADYEKRIFNPLFDRISKEYRTVFDDTISTCWEMAQVKIKDIIKLEDARYERERAQKGNADVVPNAVASATNLWAIEGALSRMEEEWKKCLSSGGTKS